MTVGQEEVLAPESHAVRKQLYVIYQNLPARGPPSQHSPFGSFVCLSPPEKESEWEIKSRSVGGEGLSSRGCQGNRTVYRAAPYLSPGLSISLCRAGSRDDGASFQAISICRRWSSEGTPIGVSGPPPPLTRLHLALSLFEMVMMMGWPSLPPDATSSMRLGFGRSFHCPRFSLPRAPQQPLPRFRPHLSCPDPASCTSLGLLFPNLLAKQGISDGPLTFEPTRHISLLRSSHYWWNVWEFII